MKYTRRFVFYPSWESRGFSYETTSDLFPVDFNQCCGLLNRKGWEVENYEWIEDKGRYFKTELMRSLVIIASKPLKTFYEEKSYEYKSINKEGELELL